MKRNAQFTVVLAVLAVALSLPIFWGRLAPDLTTIWLAGHFFAAGDLDAIYPTQSGAFSTTAPPGWAEAGATYGYGSEIFPYIYPPLWAALIAPLTSLMSLNSFQNTILVLNHLAILGTLFLAWRTTARESPLVLFFGLGLLILASGPFAALALFQNQPQIIVGFLIVLAIERARAGAGVSAGGALALAVALKVAPILLLPALLAAGPTRRVAIGFCLVGGTLGALSLGFGGLSLHSEYLAHIGNISATAILTPANYTFDALIAQLWFLDTMDPVAPYANAPDDLIQWVMTKGPAWRALSGLAMIAAAFLPALAIRRGAGVLIWPAAITLVMLTGTVAWSFYYLAPLAFLPALTARLGGLRGSVTAIALALPGTYLILPLARDSMVLPFADQALGVLILIITALVFAWLSRPRQT